VKRIDLSGFGKAIPSGITDPRLRINEDAFLPGRNLLFVLAGAAHACKVQASGVALGLLDPAQHLFPDQTLEFVNACEAMIEAAMGKRIRILTPLIEFSKSDVLAMARSRGLCGTYSCHSGGGTPCGTCVACVEIMNAEKGS
jgi:7-cyano-7-deazaguanine synthase